MISTAKTQPAFGYVRMSSSHQDKSPAQQREQIAETAKQHGFHIVKNGWFTDEGITGDSITLRREFCRLLKELEDGPTVKTVICWDQSRFARCDGIDSAEVIAPLRRAGVQLITAAEGPIDWNSFEGQIVSLVRTAGNHKFLRDLSRNTLRGRIAARDRGSFIVGVPPGLCRVFYDASGREVARAEWNEKFRKQPSWTTKVAISECPSRQWERDAMVWAFHTFAHGGSGQIGICKGLFERGLKSKTGAAFPQSTLRNILTNDKYVGTVSFGRELQGRYHVLGEGGAIVPVQPGQKKSTSVARRSGPLFQARGAHAALISQDVFEAVQRRLAQGKCFAHSRRGTGDYLLSGIMHCATCGRRMYGIASGRRVRDDGGKTFHYYYCKGWMEGKRCRTFRGAELERYLVAILDSLFSGADARERAARVASERLRARPKVCTDHLQRSLTDVEGQIKAGQANLTRVTGEDLDALRQMLEQLRVRRDSLRREIQIEAEARGRAPEGIVERDAIRAIEAAETVLQNGSRSLLRELIRQVFQSVTVQRLRVGDAHCAGCAEGRIVMHADRGPLADVGLHEQVKILQTIPMLRQARIVNDPDPSIVIDFTDRDFDFDPRLWVKVYRAIRVIGRGAPVGCGAIAKFLGWSGDRTSAVLQHARKAGAIYRDRGKSSNGPEVAWLAVEPRHDTLLELKNEESENRRRYQLRLKGAEGKAAAESRPRHSQDGASRSVN
jgi:DNA invertase Pin-like site-specific DNA recombinase